MNKLAGEQVMMPREIAALTRRAEEIDKDIRATWAERKPIAQSLNKIDVHLGKLWLIVERESLHKYVRKPGSRKGYPSIEAYAKSITGQKHTAFFLSKKMAQLTEGPNALSEAEVGDIGARKSAILAEVPPERRTLKLLEQAKTQTEKEFTRSAQAATNEGQPLEKQVIMRLDFFRKVPPAVHDLLESTIERCTRLKAVRTGPGEDAGFTLQDKALVMMCTLTNQWIEGEECAAKEKAIDLGPENATEADASETEDYLEEVAAEEEFAEEYVAEP